MTDDISVLGGIAPLVQGPWGAALLGLIGLLLVLAAVLREARVGPDGTDGTTITTRPMVRLGSRIVVSLLVLSLLILAVATLIRFATYSHWTSGGLL